MSILYGNISSSLIFCEKMPYGNRMEETSFIADPSMTVATLTNDIIICGGQGHVSVYHIDKDGKAHFVSKLSVLGVARQIDVSESFAYVTARESGVYICDFTNVENPLLAYHIDSLELATGIAVSNGVLAITNRHMGCELYDVRNPYKPLRMGDFLCGEAQSVCLYENYAIIGDWINHRVFIFDISKPNNPQKISHFYVDGYADGVCVVKRNDSLICLVAMGHHSATFKNPRKYDEYTFVTTEMIANGYGCGHGIEIFDITNLKTPKRLSTLKTPPMFGGPDTWLVYSDGESCVFTDSMNGIFTISLSNLNNPIFTGYYRLNPLEKQFTSPPSIQIQTKSITGSTVCGEYLCASSSDDGIHILRPNTHLNNYIKHTAKIDFNAKNTAKTHIKPFYRSKYQLHNFVKLKDKIFCACGEGGIEIIDDSGNFIGSYKTRGICHDLCLYNGKLYSAEENYGVACYEIGNSIYEVSRVSNIGCVRQITVAESGFAVQVGCNWIKKLTCNNGVLKVEDGECNACVLYYRHISRTLAGKYTVALPLVMGATLISTENGAQKIAFNGTLSCPFEEGACGYGDKLIVIHNGCYVCLDNPLDVVKPYNGIKIEKAVLSGIPYAFNNVLVILNRYYGTVEILNIEDPHAPKFIRRIETNGYPESCEMINGELYVSLGFDGIIKI